MTDAAINTGRRAGLDRADMVATALALVEAEGPSALTMRRLATELAVTTNTVYWHVGSRDELITEIIRTSSTRIADRAITGTSPRERVTEAARHMWDSALENRAVTSLAHQTGTTALLEHHLEVALVREIEAAGLTGDAAAIALRSILSTVGGFLVGALRDDSSVPEHLRPAALWATAVGVIDDATIDSLTRPTDLEAVFGLTLSAVVAIHIPA